MNKDDTLALLATLVLFVTLLNPVVGMVLSAAALVALIVREMRHARA